MIMRERGAASAGGGRRERGEGKTVELRDGVKRFSCIFALKLRPTSLLYAFFFVAVEI